jgi:hypothetical protein
MPAERVARAVAVSADARAEALNLGDQLFARERLKVLVHATSGIDCPPNAPAKLQSGPH